MGVEEGRKEGDQGGGFTGGWGWGWDDWGRIVKGDGDMGWNDCGRVVKGEEGMELWKLTMGQKREYIHHYHRLALHGSDLDPKNLAF